MNYFTFNAQKLCKTIGHIGIREMLTEAEKLVLWKNSGEEAFYKWCRRKRQTKQYKFERDNTVPISVLGFDGVDDITESVVESLTGGRGTAKKPVLFREEEI